LQSGRGSENRSAISNQLISNLPPYRNQSHTLQFPQIAPALACMALVPASGRPGSNSSVVNP
jgi:hypothetical protein